MGVEDDEGDGAEATIFLTMLDRGCHVACVV